MNAGQFNRHHQSNTTDCKKLNTCSVLKSLKDYNWNDIPDGDKLLADAMRKVYKDCRDKEA